MTFSKNYSVSVSLSLLVYTFFFKERREEGSDLSFDTDSDDGIWY